MRQNKHQKLWRTAQALGYSALSFVVCVAFQNCSGYAADFNPMLDATAASTCVGLSCAQDPILLRLSVTNESALAVKNGTATGVCGLDDSSCVDIGGFCDDGGYPDNIITYMISGGSVNLSEQPTGVKCVEGRFQTSITLPAGYDFANIHQLRLTIYGISSDGTRVGSTAGGSYREVSLTAYN